MKIHPITQSLLAEIDAFRIRTGMSLTAFGTEALGDPKFMGDLLRRGRTPSFETMDSVRAFMQRREKVPA